MPQADEVLVVLLVTVAVCSTVMFVYSLGYSLKECPSAMPGRGFLCGRSAFWRWILLLYLVGIAALHAYAYYQIQQKVKDAKKLQAMAHYISIPYYIFIGIFSAVYIESKGKILDEF